ncbi:MAG: CvfB family protein [Flavobacteriaceae bacterium]
MIGLGHYNTLSLKRKTDFGWFLEDDEETEILLPNKYCSKSFKVGDSIEVFCYLDSNERPVATTLSPKIERGKFRFLKVKSITKSGAFLDMGLEKDLFLPYREQTRKFSEGEVVLVYCDLDQKSMRLYASMRWKKHLKTEIENLELNKAYEALVVTKTNLGFELIVKEKYQGLLFFSDLIYDISIGQSLQVYIKNIRPDAKLDLNLASIGVDRLTQAASEIYERLLQEDGFLPYHDKSSPDEISRVFKMSKKTFKSALGILFKQTKIKIEKNGIRLV